MRGQAARASGATIKYVAGCAVTGNDTTHFDTAVAMAMQADYIIAVVGDSGGLGWNQNTAGEDDDRTDLDLPGSQSDLIAVCVSDEHSTVLRPRGEHADKPPNARWLHDLEA